MFSKPPTQQVSRPSRLQGSLHGELYRSIFIHSSEPIAIIDPRGFYLEQNAAHAELLGYSDKELQNQTPAIHLGQEVFAKVVRELGNKESIAAK